MASRKRAQRIEEKTIEKRWDIIGVTVAAFGLMLLFALTTYNKGDLSATSQQYANWIGPFGAYLAKGFLWTFGLGAFLFPLIFIAWGLSIPISLLHHLQCRWPWMILLAVTLCCGLDIHFNLFPPHLSENLSTMSPGGFVGYILYHYVFFIFGKIGATIILLTLYLISIISLTNVKLDEWIALVIERLRQMREEAARRHKEAQARRKAEEAERKKQKQLLLENKRAEQEAERLRKEEEKRAKEEEKRRREEEEEAERLRQEEEKARQTAEEQEAEIIDAELTEEEISDEESEMDKNASEEENADNQASYKIIDAYSPDKLKERENTSVLPSVRATEDYKLPSTDLLEPVEPLSFEGESEDEMTQNAEAIRQTLADFKIDVEPGPITRGPTITLYEFIPARGVRMSRFTDLISNIAAALKAVSINILAPIPGKNSVGIEVPNKNKVPVIIRELLESQEWSNTKARLPIALGKNIYGKPIIADLAKAPHLLVAGSTGSGKSVCINTIIVSLLYKFSPEQLRFIMVDPKQVELQQYNNLPHMIIPVVTDPKKAVLALQWLVNEMEKRYKLFAKVGVRKIEEFNKRMSKQQALSPTPDSEETEQEEPSQPIEEETEVLSTEEEHVDMNKEISVPRDEEEIPDKLGYIVLIVDELNDLMLVAGKEVEEQIMRITQLARAAGIHCIIATQRPSVNVITGVIKANIPARIGFKVSNRADSNTILDCIGAEKLLGNGDMLFLAPGASKTVRIQGAYVSDDEINNILDHIKTQAQPNFFEDFMKKLEQPSNEMGNEDDGEDEELIQKCIDVIYSQNRASTSMLQRALRLGYNRAARIMDILERRGIVGPSRGSKDREILQ